MNIKNISGTNPRLNPADEQWYIKWTDRYAKIKRETVDIHQRFL
jgi:hypothetical protein